MLHQPLNPKCWDVATTTVPRSSGGEKRVLVWKSSDGCLRSKRSTCQAWPQLLGRAGHHDNSEAAASDRRSGASGDASVGPGFPGSLAQPPRAELRPGSRPGETAEGTLLLHTSAQKRKIHKCQPADGNEADARLTAKNAAPR